MAVEVVERPDTKSIETEVEEKCVHHWIIEPVESAMSKGVCIKCGAVQEFRNYLAHSSWENESSLFKDSGGEEFKDYMQKLVGGMR